jgi:hypothetical protein
LNNTNKNNDDLYAENMKLKDKIYKLIDSIRFNKYIYFDCNDFVNYENLQKKMKISELLKKSQMIYINL